MERLALLHLEYGNIKAYLEQNGIENPTLQQLHDAICDIRDAKLPDVKQIGSAGSFFKTPSLKGNNLRLYKRIIPTFRIIPMPRVW